MTGLPPSPVLGSGVGSVARHFESVSTDRLVQEMRVLWDQVDDDEAVAGAQQRGEYTVYTFLVALHERADLSVLHAARALVDSSDPIVQVQGLRILRELGPPDKRPIFPEIWNIVEPLATDDADIEVLGWALQVLAWSGEPRALPILLRLIDHPDPAIRFRVAEGLLASARPVDDPPVVSALLALCDDSDPDVRWNALWEAKEHLDQSRTDVRAVIDRMATDPDSRVRELALGD